jgi:hypothetical protein
MDFMKKKVTEFKEDKAAGRAATDAWVNAPTSKAAHDPVSLGIAGAALGGLPGAIAGVAAGAAAKKAKSGAPSAKKKTGLLQGW